MFCDFPVALVIRIGTGLTVPPPGLWRIMRQEIEKSPEILFLPARRLPPLRRGMNGGALSGDTGHEK